MLFQNENYNNRFFIYYPKEFGKKLIYSHVSKYNNIITYERIYLDRKFIFSTFFLSKIIFEIVCHNICYLDMIKKKKLKKETIIYLDGIFYFAFSFITTIYYTSVLSKVPRPICLLLPTRRRIGDV